MALNTFVFYGTLGTLIGTPMVAPLVVYVSSRKRQFSKHTNWAAASCLSLVLVAYVLSISFTVLEFNAVALFVAYFCFGLLAFAAFRVKPKALGIVIGGLFSLPLIVGILFGTVGFLATGFIVQEFTPVYEATLEKDFTCRVTQYGGPIAPEGTAGSEIGIFKEILVGLERKVLHKRLPEVFSSYETACRNLYTTVG